MSQFKKKLATFTALLAFMSVGATSVRAFDATTDIIRTTNNMDITTTGTHTDFNMAYGAGNGAVGQADLSRFNIAAGTDVNIGYSGLSQVVIARVLGNEQSNILGSLTDSCIGASCSTYGDSGRFVLINPNGVLFGAGSQVDLNSFTVSTFDFNGAKNLKNMTETELANYQSNVLNKISAISSVNGESRSYGNMTFDSAYSTGFVYTPGKTISFNGANIYVDKSFNAVSDNIQYKDSLLKTGGNYNYPVSGNPQSFSNVKLVTADGVTFRYGKSGNTSNQTIKTDSRNNVKRTITIDNAGLLASDATKTAIETGDLKVISNSNLKDSNVKISNTIVKANKLVNNEYGNIFIQASGDADISNSRLHTSNTAISDGTNTIGQTGGKVYVIADQDVNVDGALIWTAESTNENGNARTYLSAGDDLNVKNSKMVIEGDAQLLASNKITVDNSLIKAESQNTTLTRETSLIAGNGVDVNDSRLFATGDLSVISETNSNALNGNINITGDVVNGQNTTSLFANNGKLSIQGANTTVDNANLVYKELKFYNDGTTGTNNVTIANNTTLTPPTSTIDIETNGNLIFDNATAKGAKFSFNFTKNSDGTLYDDGTVNAIQYKTSSSSVNAKNLNATSTNANVISKNNSNITVSNDINFDANKAIDISDTTLTAKNKIALTSQEATNIANSTLTATNNNIEVNASDIGLTESKLTAGADVNLTSSTGNVNILNNSTVSAGNDANVNAKKNAKIASSKVTAKNNANITSESGNVNVITGDVAADNNVNITASAADVNITTNSKVAAGKDATIIASKNGKIASSSIKAGNNITVQDETLNASNAEITADKDVFLYSSKTATIADSTVKSTNGYVETEASDITTTNSNYTAGTNVGFQTTTGEVKLTGSNVKATKDAYIFAQTNVKLDNSKFEAGNDATIAAMDGKLNVINSSTISATNDVHMQSHETIKFGAKGDSTINIDNSIVASAGNDMRVVSDNGNIEGEKTTMPTLSYGNRLSFNAAGDNVFTSKDSLKSVNVDYIAGGTNKFYTTNDIQFVDSTLQAPENFVEAGGDVILNNLEIKQATTDAKDTVTKIYANGDITTKDVTGTNATDRTTKPHKFPQSVDYNRKVTLDKVTADDTTLNINQTKLIAVAETVKDATLPDKGSITLNVKNANNDKAGLDLTAQNVDKLDVDSTDGNFRSGYYKSGTKKWDENIKTNEGPEIHLNAEDDNAVISSIITDKLTLSDTDEYSADKTTGGYIEVRDEGGFNFDPEEDYDPTPDDFNYLKTNETHKVSVVGGEKQPTVWGAEYEITADQYKENVNDEIITHHHMKQDGTIDTTDKVTTYKDTKHTIKFNKDDEATEFTLVYDKTRTETEKFATENVSKDWWTTDSESCPPLQKDDEVTPDIDSYINITKLPKEQVEVSKTSKVSDNTYDPTSNIMSAAAKVKLADEETNNVVNSSTNYQSYSTSATQNNQVASNDDDDE